MKIKKISIWIVILCLLVVGGLLIWVDNPVVHAKDETEKLKLSAGLLIACLIFFFLDGLGGLSTKLVGSMEFFSRWREKNGAGSGSTLGNPDHSVIALSVATELKDHLRNRYGYFWRRKVRLLLVVGEPAQIEAIAPRLAEKQWLEGQDTVLLWGGQYAGRIGSVSG